MTNNDYLSDIKKQLGKALSYLEYSYDKILKLPDDPEKLDQESLETWESYTARFSRVADIFITKYLRAIALESDPAFRGTVRDLMNYSEKLKLIDNVETWMTIRAIRNISAHEYTEKELHEFFLQLKKYSPYLLALKVLVDLDENH